MIEKISKLDRRIIFLFIAIGLVVPLLRPTALPIKISPSVQKVYDTIENIPEGSKVLFSFDYGPSTLPEVGGAAEAVLKHLFKKNIKVVAITLWGEGAPIGDEVMGRISKEMGKIEEEDWIYLGFKFGGPTGSAVIEPMGTDFKSVFPVTRQTKDKPSRPTRDVALLKDVKNYDDFKAIITFSAGVPGIKEYIQMANSRYKIVVTGGCSKVTAPELFPLLNSGQLSGFIPGVVGGAQYEKLMGYQGDAHKYVFAQSVVHIIIISFIVLGNIMFFLSKKTKEANTQNEFNGY